MPLLSLPSELLLEIAQYLVPDYHEPEQIVYLSFVTPANLLSFALTARRLAAVARPLLARVTCGSPASLSAHVTAANLTCAAAPPPAAALQHLRSLALTAPAWPALLAPACTLPHLRALTWCVAAYARPGPAHIFAALAAAPRLHTLQFGRAPSKHPTGVMGALPPALPAGPWPLARLALFGCELDARAAAALLARLPALRALRVGHWRACEIGRAHV